MTKTLLRLSRLTAAALLAAGCRSTTTRPVPPSPQRSPVQKMQPLASLGVHRVIPEPVSVTAGSGAPFALTAATGIVVSANDSSAARIGEMLAAIMRKSVGYPFAVTTAIGSAPSGTIALSLSPTSALGPENYDLSIDSTGVRITASAPAGLFHGIQTFRQLLPAAVESEQSAHGMVTAWTVPPGHIVDGPRFVWRGAMLDVARHFFTVDEVKQYIDLLALYKLNVLHLHLADDQGWRIQIDSWPRLTTVGGTTQVGGGPGGYYTKDEYGSIVRYAQDRFITIVPEIDMPAHTNAAIASYPQLGCSKPTPGIFGGTQPLGTYTGIAVGFSALCPDSEGTFKFVDDVVRELGAMTPGPYMHMGGDEVTALTNEQYSRFVERVQDIVNKHGKTMVGWEEIGKARLLPTTIAQQWKSDSALLAFRQGTKLILSPASKVYLDMKYTPTTELGLEWAGLVPLS